jgi:hypothetical protein
MATERRQLLDRIKNLEYVRYGVNNIEFCHFWWGEKAYCSGLVAHTNDAAGDFHQKFALTICQRFPSS